MSMFALPVTSQPAAARAAAQPAAASSGLPGMGGDEFMTILLAQMRHQNPLEPMDDKELISQMTSLNSLSELQKINATLMMLVQSIQYAASEEQPE